MTSEKITHKYKECGLDNVVLIGVTLFRCVDCGEECFDFGDIVALHEVIAEILIMKKDLLTGKEIRFLRKRLGLSNTVFAEKILGCSYETLSRIENGKQSVTEQMDHFVRFIASNRIDCQKNSLIEMLVNGSLRSIKRIELQKTKSGVWKEAVTA
jgi:putative zinc finger/helix-turn-helix YgiT family protein